MDNKLRIIGHLGKNMHISFTMHGLSRILSIPYASFYRTMKQMTGLIHVQDIGRAKTISLNRDNPVIRSYLSIASEEQKAAYKQPIIRIIADELNTKDIVILFGSFADNTQTKKSDIDILVISRSGRKTISFSRYELLFKRQINPIFMTRREFRLMLRQKQENLGKQVLKKHIILNNPEAFWELVLNANLRWM